MEHFNYQWACLRICHGLEHIGETQFGTIYWSALSVQHGLPAFAALVESSIDIGMVSHPLVIHTIDSHSCIVTTGSQHTIYTWQTKAPFWSRTFQVPSSNRTMAKGLCVLEAADVTANHIYYVFLGIMSQLEEDFQANKFGLVLCTLEDVCHIANNRFK